ERIWSLAFSPDNKKLASSSVTQKVTIWDLKTGKYQILQQNETNTGGTKSIAYSPDGQLLVSGSEDNTISIWDGNIYQSLQVLAGHTNRVNSVKFINNQKIISGSEDKTIRLWDVKTGECLLVFQGHTDRVTSIDFH
ncbi:MAG: WD40 repeat domain-containing protein, partial [Dolichospermum sp.]